MKAKIKKIIVSGFCVLSIGFTSLSANNAHASTLSTKDLLFKQVQLKTEENSLFYEKVIRTSTNDILKATENDSTSLQNKIKEIEKLEAEYKRIEKEIAGLNKKNSDYNTKYIKLLEALNSLSKTIQTKSDSLTKSFLAARDNSYKSIENQNTYLLKTSQEYNKQSSTDMKKLIDISSRGESKAASIQVLNLSKTTELSKVKLGVDVLDQQFKFGLLNLERDNLLKLMNLELTAISSGKSTQKEIKKEKEIYSKKKDSLSIDIKTKTTNLKKQESTIKTKYDNQIKNYN